MPKVVLAPEPNLNWVLFPSILYPFEQVVMDRRDYNIAQEKATESRFHALAAHNLQVPYNEGYVELVRYSSVLSGDSGVDIYKLGLAAERAIPTSTAVDLLTDAYSHYRNAALVRCNFLSDTPSYLKSYYAMVRELEQQCERLAMIDRGGQLDGVNENCIRQYFWKTLAALRVSVQLAPLYDRKELPFYDTEDYSVVASALIHSLQEPSGPAENLSTVAGFDLIRCRKALHRIVKAFAPRVCVAADDDMQVFLTDRRSFADFRVLLKRLSEIEDAAGPDVDKHALKEATRVMMLIKEEMSRIRRSRSLLWLPVDLLSGRAGSAKTMFGASSGEYREAQERLERVLGESAEWVFALLRLFDRSQAADIEKKLATQVSERSTQDGERRWWITGDERCPWYAQSDIDSSNAPRGQLL
jgi:hypothetical protein